MWPANYSMCALEPKIIAKQAGTHEGQTSAKANRARCYVVVGFSVLAFITAIHVQQ